jgi:RarD protein
MLMDAVFINTRCRPARYWIPAWVYYLCPLLMFCYGVIFFKERCRWYNFVALGLAVTGIAVIAVSRRGGLPLISLSIALVWSLCSLARKKANTDASLVIAV